MPASRHLCLILLLVATAGCQRIGVLAKRQQELCCPTDIRQMVPWCAGEDAVFRRPCGPRSTFYGHRPTCWGVWPAPADQWRATFCGPLGADCEQLPAVEYQLEMDDQPAMPVQPPQMLPQPEPVDDASPDLPPRPAPPSEMAPPEASKRNVPQPVEVAHVALRELPVVSRVSTVAPPQIDCPIEEPIEEPEWELPQPMPVKAPTSAFRPANPFR